MSEKVDFKKTLDSYQARTGQFRVVDVPELRYLMVDGHGDPNSAPAFAQALESLYPVAYTLKFASRRDLDRDYVVPPLEGLWWAEDMDAFTAARDKSRWDWTLLLMVPDWIDTEFVESALAVVGAKKERPPRLDDIRVETLTEGQCVQTLHVGPFDAEAAVLERMHHEFIPAHNLALTGTHHEVYFSDVRRVAPDRRRTLLRQPVTDA